MSVPEQMAAQMKTLYLRTRKHKLHSAIFVGQHKNSGKMDLFVWATKARI